MSDTPYKPDIATVLTWVLRQSVDITIDRLHGGLASDDAAREIRDLMAMHRLAIELGARGPMLDRCGTDLAHAHQVYVD